MIKLTGESTRPPFDVERTPMLVHPAVVERLRRLLMRRELRAVGYTEFLERAVRRAEEELEAGPS